MAEQITQTAAGSALRQRVITALVLIPLVVGAVLWLPSPVFAGLLAVIMARGVWEWCALCGMATPAIRALMLGGLFAGALVLWWSISAQFLLASAAALWWFWQGARLMQIRTVEPFRERAPDVLANGLAIVLAAWAALVYLHQMHTPGLVLFVLLLIWTADSAAYFAGRRWGRVKLAPVLSPGKTWAGVYGALFGAALCALILAGLSALGTGQTLLLVLVCGVTALISVIGDLYESLLKRRSGVKDSGRLLPGHGGLLDRIDSLLAAAPVFLLGLTLIGVEL